MQPANFSETRLPVQPDSQTAVKPEIRLPVQTDNQTAVKIVIVGKTNSGKSTICDVLDNVCHVVGRTAMLPLTHQPELREYELGGYQLKVLDTPGLFQRAKNGETKRENEEIDQLIQGSVKQYFGCAPDVVLMTISTDMDSEDIESLKFGIEKFPLTTKKILVFTRCEDFWDVSRNALRGEIFQNKFLSMLIDRYFGGKILFSGAVNHQSLSNLDSTMSDLERVFLDRECLIKALLPAEERLELEESRVLKGGEQVDAFLDRHFHIFNGMKAYFGDAEG